MTEGRFAAVGERIHFPNGEAVVVENPYNEPGTGTSKGLLVKGHWHELLSAYIESHDAKALYLNASRGWNSKDFKFLKDVPSIEELYIIAVRASGLEAVQSLMRLRRLSLDVQTSSRIDFTQLAALRRVYLEWNDHSATICEAPQIIHLTINRLPKSAAGELAMLSRLKHLSIYNSNVETVSFSSGMALEGLELSYCKSLTAFEAIGDIATLKRLELIGCPMLRNLGFVKQLQDLEILRFDESRAIQTLRPLAVLQKLKAISFTGRHTTIVDGDLLPLTKLPKLALLAFADRRHYSHRLVKRWDWAELERPSKVLEPKQ